ncbi:MAG: hypothetical protein KGD60_13435 [Candidatus Thorarchaeota archaeon]|nr:hypothetical protein [Candidatus Thorarchaeota archaeon]
MSEDPLMTIEAYLGHVREHLPESMADEVIAELRGYMIEMTEALSDGAVTSTAAKKVVARFGAPSELAKEYVLFSSDPAESDLEVSQLEFEEDMQEQRRELSPAGYAGTFRKFITITVLWLVICWTTITPFAYWWIGSPAIFVPFLQFGAVVVAFVVLLLRSKIKGIQLRNVIYGNWSRLQKLVTFPENLALEIYRIKVLVDIGLTILTASGFIVLSSYSYPAITMFFVPPTVLLLIGHLVYAVRRFGNTDPVSRTKQEFVVNIGLLLFLNTVIAWGFYPWSSNPVGPFLVWISIGYSTLILYQIVIRTQDLWWETMGFPDDYSDKSPGLSPDAKSNLLNRIKKTALRTIRGIAATYSVVIISGLLFPLLTNIGISWYIWNTQGIYLVVMVSFFAITSVGLASVYFGVRYYLVLSRGRTSVFGKRTRVEAAIDLLVTGAGLFIIIIPSWSYWSGALVSEVLSLSSGANPLVRLVLSTAIIAWMPFLFIAIIARLAADIGDLRQGDSVFAQEVITFSGNMFLIQAALMTGIYYMLLSCTDPYMLFLREMFAILGLSYSVMVLFVFQKSTAGAKLKLRKETESSYQKDQAGN